MKKHKDADRFTKPVYKGDATRCGAPRMRENRSAIWQIADRFTKSVYTGGHS